MEKRSESHLHLVSSDSFYSLIFFLLSSFFFILLFSSLLWLFPPLLSHLSILSEVWRRNFLWQTRICIYVFLFVRENRKKHIHIYTHAHACTWTWGAPRWTIIPRWITLCGCKPSLVVAPFFQKRLGGCDYVALGWNFVICVDWNGCLLPIMAGGVWSAVFLFGAQKKIWKWQSCRRLGLGKAKSDHSMMDIRTKTGYINNEYNVIFDGLHRSSESHEH